MWPTIRTYGFIAIYTTFTFTLLSCTAQSNKYKFIAQSSTTEKDELPRLLPRLNTPQYQPPIKKDDVVITMRYYKPEKKPTNQTKTDTGYTLTEEELKNMPTRQVTDIAPLTGCWGIGLIKKK